MTSPEQRPRVEGEAMTPEQLLAEAARVEQYGYTEHVRFLRASADRIAALIAEVERLREAGEWFLYCVEGEQILAIPDEDQRATFAAALALPTNAPEATDG